MNRDTLRLADELAERGEPFAFVTVVWRRAPSSGKEGSAGIVTTDRRIRGWIGGACAEPTVVREAIRAIEEGTPRLLFLGPPEELAARGREGVVTVPIACQSEGALEVYVEPFLPQPQLVAIGRSEAVDALASMARALGWRTAVVDDGGDPSDHPDVDRVLTSLDLSEEGIGDRSFVVVATQGHYDEEGLRAALETDAAYVGLVASKRRAESVLGYLRDRGVDEARLARVRAPAGIDLGRTSHREIAVAVLAELVRERAAGTLGSGVATQPPPPHEEVDPVCGMTVEVATARYRTVHDGRTYYLCSARCLQRFEADPTRYPAPTG